MFRKHAANDEENEGEGRRHQTLGAFFQEARLARQLELSTLARETSITVNHLLALEEDNRAALPADVYTRGFVRIYAAQLGLDPSWAIRLYEQQWGANHRHPDIDRFFEPERNLAPLIWGVLGLAVLAGAVFLGLRFYQDRQASGLAVKDVIPRAAQVKGRHKPAPANQP